MGGTRSVVKGKKKKRTMVLTAYAEPVYRSSCPRVVQRCFDKINVNQLARLIVLLQCCRQNSY